MGVVKALNKSSNRSVKLVCHEAETEPKCRQGKEKLAGEGEYPKDCTASLSYAATAKQALYSQQDSHLDHAGRQQPSSLMGGAQAKFLAVLAWDLHNHLQCLSQKVLFLLNPAAQVGWLAVA